MSAALDIKAQVAALTVTVEAVKVKVDALKAGALTPEDAQALADAAVELQAASDKLSAL